MPRAAALLLLLLCQAAESAVSRAEVIARAAAVVAAPILGSEVYARLPERWDNPLPPLPVDASKDVQELILVIPGAGGPDANTKRIAESLGRIGGTSAVVVEYDWKAFVGGQLKAPFNAMRVGDFLADEVRRARPKRLHVIGVSVGGFAADRLTARVASFADAPQLQLTLLDPFTARGLPGLIRPTSAYGVNNFGKTLANAPMNVFNADDPVPSTNLPLRHAINFDITAAAERRDFVPLPGDSLHSWPAAWYGRHPKALDDARATASSGGRGGVIVVD